MIPVMRDWQRMSAIQRRQARAGLLFVLPWLIGMTLFMLYPIVASLYFSFTDYTVLERPRWVGFENYETLLTNDPSFRIAVANSLIYALMAVPTGLIVSLGLALLLNFNERYIGVYRTLFYLPSLAPPVAGTVIFLVLFNPQGGLMNAILEGVGLQRVGWFEDPDWSKPSLVLLSLWGVGAGTLIFLAGLKEVPQSLLESASIDGANVFQRFWHITIPMLSPVILFNLVMGVISSFQVFTQAFVIGGTTGRPLESTLMVMVLIYRNAFRYFKMGYASAIAVALAAVILVVTVVIFRVARSWVFSEVDPAT